MTRKSDWSKLKKICALLCSIVLLLLLAAPVYANADTIAKEPTKVGFFEYEGYHGIDSQGCRKGYGYDFLVLAQRYANLDYEFVGYDRSWEDMLLMLEKGQIDLLTAASKTPEREEKFAYSLPIGSYYICISARSSDTRFKAGEFDTYNGMVIGLLEGSENNRIIEEFARENGFSYTPRYYQNGIQLKNALDAETIDAIGTSSLRRAADEVVLSRFHEQDFYAIVRKNDKTLLNKINYAISEMNLYEGDWKSEIYYNNYVTGGHGINFSNVEKAYIKRRSDEYTGTPMSVCIAVDSDWAPFSWKKDDTYVGIMPEFVENCMNMAGMNFYFYEGADDIHDSSVLLIPEVDMFVGYALSDREAEKSDFITSQPILECAAAYLIRRDFNGMDTVAICETTPYLNTLLDVDDSVQVRMYRNTSVATKALLKNEVDAVFLYSYDAENTINQGGSGRLAYELLPGMVIHVKAAVRADDSRNLISIFSKCFNQMNDDAKNSIISKYLSYSADDISIKDYILMYPEIAIAVGVAVLGLICAVLFRRNTLKARYSRELENKVDEITMLNLSLQENQDKLEKSTKAAESANLAKTSFLFNMSHDIRTPMNAIIGYTELLKHNIDDKEKCHDYLNKVESAEHFLLSLINNVLEMARIESGKATLDESVESPREMFDEIVAVYSDLMRKKNIDFVQAYDVKTEYVYVDQLKVREILLNLVSNAYKYTRDGGRIAFRGTELPSEKEGYTIIETVVEDTGIGMSKEFVPLLFEQFSRESNYTDNKIEGTGLGLSIVKKLVEIMGGTIEVESELGKGSKFTVRLEHKIAEKPEEPCADDEQIEEEAFVGKRILLAEDNDLNAEIAVEILNILGIEVERAEDGVKCLDMLTKAESGYYDLILTDIQMPNMNGYVLARTIRKLDDKEKANIPVYAMTANAFGEDKQNAFDSGMNGHLSKPIEIRNLMQTLHKEFDKKAN